MTLISLTRASTNLFVLFSVCTQETAILLSGKNINPRKVHSLKQRNNSQRNISQRNNSQAISIVVSSNRDKVDALTGATRALAIIK